MKRLLFIAHRLPYPPDKGDRLRAFHEIAALSGRFRVTLAALAHHKADYDAAGRMKHWCDEVILAPAGRMRGQVRAALAVLGGKSATEGFFHSPSMQRRLREASARQQFDIVLAYCSSTLGLALDVPAVAHVMDLVDIDSAKWSSYAEQAPWSKRWLYRREAAAVRRLEHQAIRRFDTVLAVSEAEAKAIEQVDQRVISVTNGVDTDHFAPGRVPPARGVRRPSVVFTGQMDYRPNVDAVCWFVTEVWGRLKRHVADLSFIIVGRNPLRAVRRLTRAPGVHVTGPVPDVRPYVAGADIAVAPLRIARGIQNKVLEAMAMGLPVVASPAALEGLDAETGREVLQADAPDEWCERIVGLLRDDAAGSQLGRAARQCAVTKYQWAVRMAPLVSLCERLCRKPPVKPTRSRFRRALETGCKTVSQGQGPQ